MNYKAPNRVKVKVLDIRTDSIKQYDCIRLAARAIGATADAVYVAMAKSKQGKFSVIRKRYIVRRLDEEFPDLAEILSYRKPGGRPPQPVTAYDGATRTTYCSIALASRLLTISDYAIRQCLKSERRGVPRTVRGYRFTRAASGKGL